MVGMNSIFEALSEELGIGDRLMTIDHLFSHVECATIGDWLHNFSNDYDESLESVADGPIFLSWPHRGGTSSPLHMKQVLGVTDPYAIRDDRVKVCHYLEYVYNITDLVLRKIKGLGGECDQNVVMALAKDLADAAGSLGMKFVDADDGRHLLCVNDAPIIEAASISEPNEMSALVEYLHYASDGDLEKKGSCLTRLYKGYEGRMIKLVGAEFEKLKDEVGFLANSLNTRHNNLEGKNAKPALEDMPESELERWYDYLAGLFAEAILAEKRVDMRSESKELRERLRR